MSDNNKDELVVPSVMDKYAEYLKRQSEFTSKNVSTGMPATPHDVALATGKIKRDNNDNN